MLSPSPWGTTSSPFIDELRTEPTLREAWYRVQRGGKTAGVDGITVDAFRAHADRRLREVSTSLAGGTYRPSALKRVQIRKPSGGWRTLGIPTVLDRVVHAAAAMLLHTRIAAHFSERSFAYRPFLGPRRAALFLRSVMTTATWAVTADIEQFFDNVDHRILAGQLRSMGVDDGGVHLVLQWLTAPSYGAGQAFRRVKGLPQGSPVAPILANLYLNGFDTAVAAEGLAHVRYADDFVVLCATHADAQHALRFVGAYLQTRLKLALKPSKTQLTSTIGGLDFVGFHFTSDSWSIPDASMTRLRESLTTMMARPDGRQVRDVSERHNAIVRGWRSYYYGNSDEMDRQLVELDTWRDDQCARYLQACGQPQETRTLWFESLLADRPSLAPEGLYSTAAPATTDGSDVTDDAWPPESATPPPAALHRFSRPQHIHDAAIGDRQAPTICGRTLTIPTFGAYVTKSRELLIIRRKKQTIFECAFDDVSCLTVEAAGVSLSTTVIDDCARRGITMVICRSSGRLSARMIPARSLRAHDLLRSQWRARLGRTGLRLVRILIGAKLANQRALLLYHAKYVRRDVSVKRGLQMAAEAIARCAHALAALPEAPMPHARTQVFLIEAKAAAHYWQAFALLVPAKFQFHRRAHRDAVDVINKSLNYAYGILMNRVWLAVYHAGLEPALGLLHTGRRRSPGLVFDLMEPYRQPIVDRAVLGLIGRRARLSLNNSGELSLRSRALLQKAVARRIARMNSASAGRGPLTLQRQVVAFRRALATNAAFQPYKMPW